MTTNTDRLALRATLHCLTGCGIGEVLGLVIATALGWGDVAAIALAVVLAFLFGYAFTFVPLIRGGLAVGAAVGIALAADTLSITVMEIVDNAIILAVPGAMEAGLDSLLFWGSLAVALAVAFFAAYPVNRWLIARGTGPRHRPPPPLSERRDVAVVGAGVMGLASAWAIARKGRDVAVLEQFEVGHPFGSSHGALPHLPLRLRRAGVGRARPGGAPPLA